MLTLRLFTDASLMRRGNAHILAILRDSAPSHLYAFGLQALRDVFVGEWMSCVLLFNHLFYTPLQDQQRSPATGRPLHRLREKVAQLKNTLWRMRVFARNRAAHRRWMHADLFRDFLDHHRL